MQIKVESFGVAYEVKVKKIIEKQSGKRNWRKKVTIKSRSAWLLLMIWFLSKVGKSLIGKLQEEMELSVSGLKKLTKFHERTAFQLNNILNGNEQLADWLTYGRTVLCQKIELKKVTQWRIIDPSPAYHYWGSFWQALPLNICIIF